MRYLLTARYGKSNHFVQVAWCFARSRGEAKRTFDKLITVARDMLAPEFSFKNGTYKVDTTKEHPHWQDLQEPVTRCVVNVNVCRTKPTDWPSWIVESDQLLLRK